MGYIEDIVSKNQVIIQKTTLHCKKTIKNVNLHRRALDEINILLHRDPDLLDPNFEILCYVDIELESSVFLALNGYYDDSVAVLRIVLETCLRKIHAEDTVILEEQYFEIRKKLEETRDKKRKEKSWTKKNEAEYRQSLKELDPSFNHTLEYLFEWVSVQNFDALRGDNSFKKELIELHKTLCSYVHPSKYRILFRDNIEYTSSFNSEYFDEWARLYCLTMKVLTIIFFFIEENVVNWRKYPSRTFKKLYPQDYDFIQNAIKKYFDEKDERQEESWKEYASKNGIPIKRTLKKSDSSTQTTLKF